jgi:asparagine synthase (glutamine-hydrolysing)
MEDHRTGCQIVFNGEIYNFKELRAQAEHHGETFQSQSDTEVILTAYRLWGRGCLQRLQGMFAFALWDPRTRVLLLARDRAGEKPLFYHATADHFLFASELKAILQHPSVTPVLDSAALPLYLGLGYVPGETCLLRGFKKLRAAHFLEVGCKDGRVHASGGPYWTIPPVSPKPLSPGECVEELERRLGEAVRRQLVADVPVGVLLSGGVDSSLITALAARHISGRLRTFTIRFPGHGRFDETKHARLVATAFGTDHHELETEPSTTSCLPLLARQFDEPIADSSLIPTFLVSRLTRRHCTVALGGDGGDELFGGYTHYRRLLALSSSLGRVPVRLRRLLASPLHALLPLAIRGRHWLAAVTADYRNTVPYVCGHFEIAKRKALLSAEFLSRLASPARTEELFALASAGPGTLLQRATRADFQLYLCEDILVKVDRASMLNSLELRAPFLDPSVIEFAFTHVPDPLKATPRNLKVLPKALCKRLLPKEFDLQRKQGFSIPMAQWLQGEFGTFCRTILSQADESLFNRRFLLSMLHGERRIRANAERLFAVVLFELWRREYRVRTSTT